MRANFPGRCPACGGPIEPGDAIENAPGERWRHVACTAPAAKLAPRRGHLVLVWDRDAEDREAAALASMFEKCTR